VALNDVMFHIRLAQPHDFQALVAFDQIAQADPQRSAQLQHAISANLCYVAIQGGQPIGYAILTYTFFARGFVELLYIHPDFRRQGAAAQLMIYLETACQTDKLFTSTNLSNLPMQSLLAKLDYKLSGVIENLDEGDPELVYFKRLREPRRL
jgi:GNAT superfamily N-acetyltransferase